VVDEKEAKERSENLAYRGKEREQTHSVCGERFQGEKISTITE
jgi:hypothetical protein